MSSPGRATVHLNFYSFIAYESKDAKMSPYAANSIYTLCERAATWTHYMLQEDQPETRGDQKKVMWKIK